MVHGVAAPGLAARSYFNRNTDALLCRVMGLSGKPAGMIAAEVEKHYRDGHIREIAEYCESDVLNTSLRAATTCRVMSAHRG